MARNNFVVEFGMNETLLTLAIEARNYERAEEIILQNSHTSFLDEGCYHRTPLYMVLSGAEDVRFKPPFTERNFHLAKLLIQHGARVNYRVPHTCFGSEFFDPGRTSLQLLGELFNSVTGLSDDGIPCKWNSIENPVIGLNQDFIHEKEALIEDILNLVMILFTHSADTGIRYKDRQTVLHRTALNSTDIRLFKVLLSEGVNVNIKDISFNTVLLSLCKSKKPSHTQIEFIDFLLKQPDLEVNATDLGDCTALLHCLYDGNVDVARKLLCRGADPCIKGLMSLKYDENISVQDILPKCISPLFVYLSKSSRIVNGHQVTDTRSISPLVDCGYFDHEEILQELLEFQRILCPDILDLESLGLRLIKMMFGGATSSLRQLCARAAFQNSLHALNNFHGESFHLNDLLQALRLPKTLTLPFEVEYFREKLASLMRLSEEAQILLPENLSDSDISDESDGEYW